MHRLSKSFVTTMLLTVSISSPGLTVQRSNEQYGLEASQPIEVCEPQGQRQYLARLICPNGEPPQFERRGNVGPRTPLPVSLTRAELDRMIQDNINKTPLPKGATDYHFIDAYAVRCESQTTTLYMDMYHCATDVPHQAPLGFRIIP